VGLMARPEHVIRLAQLKLIRDSAILEVELQNHGPSYFYTIYKRFRDAAAESIAAIAFVEPTDAKAVQALQLDIKVYDRFVEEVSAFITQGRNLDQETSDAERQEVLDLLLAQGPEGEDQAIDLGLIDRGPTD
jgi:hypothetical protein